VAKRSHNSTESPSDIAQDQRPRSVKYYLIGTKIANNIGSYATKGYIHAKDFLSKEIPMPSILKSSDNRLNETGSVANIKKHSGKHTGIVHSEEIKSADISKDGDGDAVNDNDSLVIPDEQNSKKEHQKTIEEIKKLTKRSNEVLCSARSVFPFSLFPDDVVLDRTKLTITKRDFFMSSQVMSIRIEDILNVTTDVGPFLGSINVAIRIMNSDDHVSVNNLRRRDAIHLKHIIQGYVIAQHNKIDVAHLNRNELVETLTDLGHDLSV
jgi:hypothetical protein